MYADSLKEFYRVLKKHGVLVVKIQDTIDGRVQYFSHVEVINQAVKLGFYPVDLFILLSKHRLPQHNLKQQLHARKYHCYFLVFIKTRLPVQYTPVPEL